MSEMADSHNGHNGHLTSGRLLARNTVWNLLGSGAPMIVAVFCIPILIRGLGTDRFGVLLLGLAGTATVFLISPWLVGQGLNVPAALQGETLQAFRLLGISLPFVVTTAGLRGFLEAHQRFGLINA